MVDMGTLARNLRGVSSASARAHLSRHHRRRLRRFVPYIALALFGVACGATVAFYLS